ncbi:hypothetical protein F511_03581 [Dorcoceras hygrometricum]|uniref:Glucose-6-phosphate dehydrogenase (NADP(+)) n=1 Tax=Dorcoceras hygrometricum TaxID=472368 RepID=A0A2Z7DAN7_9LAMI|nr:hypothetical protein F511_03581 [Dorcoceras hygrometricum]
MAAKLLNPCSHSFSISDNEPFSNNLSISQSTINFPKWVPKKFFRLQKRNHFQLRSSNGRPLNAVSVQDEGSAANPLAEETQTSEFGGEHSASALSIVVVGASGDLAKKKIFPALFALYYEDWLPENFFVFGYSRTKMNDEELRKMISATLTCRIDRRENCDEKMEQFLRRCFYHSGQYNSEEDFSGLHHKLSEKEELVENLSVLRFSNLIFEPLWSRNYIRNVQFIFSEDFGTEGRGGYFDHYGIIRDIMQNHLLQILALFAMETPVSLDAEDIRNEKVKVLRSMRPLQLEDVIIGQYKGQNKGGKSYPGYIEDPTVPKDSITPTFAAAALFINNARWDGVPFLMKAGKALHTKRAEIRVQFRHVPGNLYKRNFGTDMDKATNELVLRVQPDEAIYVKINNKVPGLGMRLDRSDLNLLYKSRYLKEIPDAYERLLLDAIAGERRLFIRSDELDAAWALFTPLLKELEHRKISPELYPYGSRGPDNLAFPLFCADWNVDEEMKLLEDMSYVMGKSKEELQAMFQELGESNNNKESQDELIGEEKQKISAGKDVSAKELFGYNSKRQDFEIEYDNEAEKLLADMEFKDRDTEAEHFLKVQILNVYNKRLDERKRRKDFVLDRSLMIVDPSEKNLTLDERELCDQLKVFTRFHSKEKHDELLSSVIEEHRILKRIQDLQRSQFSVMFTIKILQLALFEKYLKFNPSLEPYVQEKQLCGDIRILPTHYLHIVQTMTTEISNGNVTKSSDAHALFKVDPEKIDKVFDMLIRKGIVPKHD